MKQNFIIPLYPWFVLFNVLLHVVFLIAIGSTNKKSKLSKLNLKASNKKINKKNKRKLMYLIFYNFFTIKSAKRFEYPHSLS